MSYVTIYKVLENGDVVEHAEGSNNHTFAPLVWDFFLAKYGYGTGAGRFTDSYYTALWRAWPDPKMPRLEQVLLGATFDRVWLKREAIPELIEACEWFLREHVRKPRQVADWRTNGQTVAATYDDRTLAGDGPDSIHKRSGIIKALKEIFEDPTARGAAFNCCSAVSSFWHVRDVAPFGVCEDGTRHTVDSDCTVEDNDCTGCGVWHASEPCVTCKATGFHALGCEDFEWESRPWNIDTDVKQPRGEYRGQSAWELSARIDEAVARAPAL